MVDKKIYNNFVEIYNNMYSEIDTSYLPDKYLNLDLLYQRFYPVLFSMKEKDLTNGLDFGCGVGGTVVLGELLGIHMCGIDIPYFTHTNIRGYINPYTIIQKYLIDIGYNFTIIDTFVFPWKVYKNDKFDFVLSFNSLGEDYSDQHNVNHLQFDSKDMNNRLNELYRISKNNAIWMVGGSGKYKKLKNSKFYKKKLKKTEIDVISWEGSDII